MPDDSQAVLLQLKMCTARMPASTATSGAGTTGTNRRSTSAVASEPSSTTMVSPRAWPRPESVSCWLRQTRCPPSVGGSYSAAAREKRHRRSRAGTRRQEAGKPAMAGGRARVTLLYARKHPLMGITVSETDRSYSPAATGNLCP